MKRIPSLDGLRAISIAMVIVYHHWYAVPIFAPLAVFGVQVFFVVSGYLITNLLQQEQDSNGRISLRDFYRRRCFRIFPAAFVYILVIAAVVPSTRRDLPWSLTYTISFHHYVSWLVAHMWSLSIEEQFYLLWPLAMVFFYRYRGPIAWAAFAGAALFRLGVVISGNPSQLLQYYTFPGAMDNLAAGCLLAIYERRLRAKFPDAPKETAMTVILPVIGLVLVTRRISPFFSPVYGIVPLVIACWVFIVVSRRGWFLNNRAITTVGVLSYSLYLWQQPFTHLESFPLALALIFLFAVSSYVMVEKPMIQFGKITRTWSARWTTTPQKIVPCPDPVPPPPISEPTVQNVPDPQSVF